MTKYAHQTSSQFALIIVDAKGNMQLPIPATSAFQGYLDKWIPDPVRQEARQIAISAADEKKVRRRRESFSREVRHPERNQPPLGAGGDGGGNGGGGNRGGSGGGSGGGGGGGGGCGGGGDGEANEEDCWNISPHGKPVSHDAISRGTAPHDDDQDLRFKKRPSQDDTATSRKRKSVPRPEPARGGGSTSGSGEEYAGQGLEYHPLIISDEDAITTFYMTRLRQMQQLMCKVVAKAWIKVIEPKKQSNYPYNRGNESRPSWWPENVRHKEPDHLMKPGENYRPLASFCFYHSILFCLLFLLFIYLFIVGCWFFFWGRRS